MNNPRIILTLDAGGTNFVFSAMQANRQVVLPVRLPAHGDNLDTSLESMVMGEVIGDALSNAIALFDGLIVIGGGLSSAYSLFIQSILDEMNGTIETYSGDKLPRIIQQCFDLEDADGRQQLIQGKVKEIQVPGTQKTLRYDSMKHIGIGRAVLDTSQAVSVGAYEFALNELDKHQA